MAAKPPKAPPLTNKHLETLASTAMSNPGHLSRAEIRELGGALLRRVEPRRGGHA
jgi:chromosome segregation and condensation protein ScpB